MVLNYTRPIHSKIWQLGNYTLLYIGICRIHLFSDQLRNQYRNIVYRARANNRIIAYTFSLRLHLPSETQEKLVIATICNVFPNQQIFTNPIAEYYLPYIKRYLPYLVEPCDISLTFFEINQFSISIFRDPTVPLCPHSSLPTACDISLIQNNPVLDRHLPWRYRTFYKTNQFSITILRYPTVPLCPHSGPRAACGTWRTWWARSRWDRRRATGRGWRCGGWKKRTILIIL